MAVILEHVQCKKSVALVNIIRKVHETEFEDTP